jgi:hypothetical protein
MADACDFLIDQEGNVEKKPMPMPVFQKGLMRAIVDGEAEAEAEDEGVGKTI